MAILSNINDKFAVDSTGAIQFNGQAGTSGYVLKSNGNAAPTWVDASTVIGGPYLPLSGGTLTGATATASGISFTVGGALTGTTASFNAGTTNVVATFTSTDGIAGIALVDNSGNVELSASGNTFQVQPAGGAAALSVTSTSATFAGSINGSGIELSNYMQIKVDDAEIYWTNTANNDYWRWKRDASNNFILDHYNGSSTTAALTFNSTQNATFTGSVTANAYLMSNGSLTQNSFWGTTLNAGTGSYADFALLDSGTTRIIHVPTGTRNVVFESNVGIGTISPSSTLSLQNSQSTAANNTTTGSIFQAVSPNSGVFMRNRGNSAGIGGTPYSTQLFTDTGAGNFEIYNNAAAFNLVFGTNATERMRIDSSGNVGIGTSSIGAGYKLQVKRDTNVNIGFGLQNSGASLEAVNDAISANVPLSLYASKILLLNGNVGIGTTSPSCALDFGTSVANDKRIIGTYVNGNLFTGIGMSATTAGIRIAGDLSGNNLLDIGYYSTDGNYTWSSTMFIANTNVGIGTITPVNKIQANYAPVAIASLTASSGTSSTNWNRNAFLMGTGASVSNALAFGVSGTANDRKAWIQSGHPDSAANSLGTISLNPLGGNVGIGTTSPFSYQNYRYLQINGGNTTQGGIVRLTTSDGSYVNEFAVDSTGGYISSSSNFLLYTQNQVRLYVNSGGNVGIGVTSPSDKLEVTTSASQYTGRFDYTGSSGGAYGCLKLRISANTSPSFIDLFYDGFSTNPLSPVGAIVTTGSSVLYSSFSDYRLKENIADLTGALDKVNSLQPKTFNYINRPETTNEGFLAHELQEIVPQAVSGTKDGVDENGNPKYQGVDNAHLVPLLVGAIKELKADNDSLKARIETLENK